MLRLFKPPILLAAYLIVDADCAEHSGEGPLVILNLILGSDRDYIKQLAASEQSCEQRDQFATARQFRNVR